MSAPGRRTQPIARERRVAGSAIPAGWWRCGRAACLTLALFSGPAVAEDGGQPEAQPAPGERTLSTEDQEAVDNLELLESLDEVDQLDLLLELSGEER